MDAPFIDKDLEDNILRLVLVDDRNDDLPKAKEFSHNVGYLMNIGFPKDIFTSPFRQWLYEETINNYVKHTEAIPRSILISKMRGLYKNHLQLTRQVVALDKILEKELHVHSFKPLAEDLKIKYNYRKLFELTVDLREKLQDHYENDKKESLDLVRHAGDSISKIFLTTNRFRIIEEDAFHNIDKEILEIKERKANPEKYKGIPTGFESINVATGGWVAGELSVVLGRPGMGKSILLMNFAYTAYVERYNVIYITIEMPLEQQRRRLYCRIINDPKTKDEKINIPYTKFKMPHLLEDHEVDYIEKQIRNAKNPYSNYLWYIDAPENCNATFLESRVLAFESTVGKKAELLIIDPLYLMTPNDKYAEDKVGAISWDLKLLGRKLNVPVIAASQFNREGGKRHQSGHGASTMDAAFSDKLSNNADNMMGILGGDQDASLTFPKTRDSSIQEVFLTKRFEYMRFEDKKS